MGLSTRSVLVAASLFSVFTGTAWPQAALPEQSSPRSNGFDPNWLFDTMDRNKDGVVTRDELMDRRSLDRFDDYCRRAGVTDGRLTREAFLKAFAERMAERMRSGGNRWRDPERLFRNLDRNGDGKLDKEELQQTQRLKNEIAKWDKNQDGAIDLAEFKAYIEALERETQLVTAIANGPPPTIEELILISDMTMSSAAEPRKEPNNDPISVAKEVTVYRAGKLPPGLPPWFAELDTDGDGQVALHEWKDRPIEEFFAIDRNGDGFITIEEALWYVNQKKN